MQFPQRTAVTGDIVLTVEGDQAKTCLICYTPITQGKSQHLLSCRHQFCTECLKAYITEQISTRTLVIRCPGQSCRSILTDSVIKQLVTPSTLQKRQEFLILTRPRNRLCPNRCGGFCTTTDTNIQEKLQCICGTQFCSLCSLPWHGSRKCLPVTNPFSLSLPHRTLLKGAR
jgi:hypothetical protein